ncbi:hypothetical protein [Paraburkholderia sp. BCC1885]|uniref:hypothetical protein n=1 Tax=Paraburkholderia sp. BCC1885 TaxID=2562669 RepID=UPI001183D57B|nr:hypothetical protein [Paraburkholderia sp. BCC1885]
MRPSRPLLSRPWPGILAAWSVLCLCVMQLRFPHFLFICEHVEALYDGHADDTVVYHVMQGLVVLAWGLGVVAAAGGAWMVRRASLRR